MKEYGIVQLRPLTKADTANIVKWRNKADVRKNLFSQKELTEEQHLQHFANNVETGKCAQYVISVVENGLPVDIGTVFIKNIDRENLNGEFGMFIGEDQYRGKGIAGSVIEQILDIAFSELRLHRVYLSVMAYNMPAIKAYRKAGFAEEGVLKESYFRDDSWIDILLMGITETMWAERKNDGHSHYRSQWAVRP